MEKSNTNVYNINNSLSQQTQIERTGWSQAEKGSGTSECSYLRRIIVSIPKEH